MGGRKDWGCLDCKSNLTLIRTGLDTTFTQKRPGFLLEDAPFEAEKFPTFSRIFEIEAQKCTYRTNPTSLQAQLFPAQG